MKAPKAVLMMVLLLACAFVAEAAYSQGRGGGGRGGGGGGHSAGHSGWHGGGGHRWHGGGGHHHRGGWHGSRVVVGVGVGFPGYWYGGWPSYYYPRYYGYSPYYYPYPYYSAVGVPYTGSVEYVEQGTAQPAQPGGGSFYYYCPDSQNYYPYVKQCPSNWERVPTVPPSERVPTIPPG